MLTRDHADIGLERWLQDDGIEGSGDRGTLISGSAAQVLITLGEDDAYRSRFVGNVRLLYLDPPFNTGETFAHYSDARHPELWASEVREVLKASVPFLAEDASIWFHIDDANQHVARVLMDEVFGRSSFVGTVIWQKRTTRDNRTAFSSMHDYLHVYSPGGAKIWKKSRNPLPDTGAFQNWDDDPRGPWRSVPLSVQAGHGTPSQFYSVQAPNGSIHHPPTGRCWAYNHSRFLELVAAGRVYWPRQGGGRPRLKRYQSEVSGVPPHTIWTAKEVGGNADGKRELLAAFPGIVPFDTPKPLGLMNRIVAISTNPGDVVLDCFLGTGTTAIAAGMTDRQWVGIEREPVVLSTFTVPRLRSTLAGPVGGGFRMLRLAATQGDVASLSAEGVVA